VWCACADSWSRFDTHTSIKVVASRESWCRGEIKNKSRRPLIRIPHPPERHFCVCTMSELHNRKENTSQEKILIGEHNGENHHGHDEHKHDGETHNDFYGDDSLESSSEGSNSLQSISLSLLCPSYCLHLRINTINCNTTLQRFALSECRDLSVSLFVCFRALQRDCEKSLKALDGERFDSCRHAQFKLDFFAAYSST
jgi:hypothetical protein